MTNCHGGSYLKRAGHERERLEIREPWWVEKLAASCLEAKKQGSLGGDGLVIEKPKGGTEEQPAAIEKCQGLDESPARKRH